MRYRKAQVSPAFEELRDAIAELERVEQEQDKRRAKSSPWYYIPHAPHPKQLHFLKLQCFEAMYGGAAGGGKSDALLMAALQYAHVPGYAALLLRRTYQDLALPEAIMDRAKQWLIPKKVHWNDKDKRFTFPSGATLTFGYLDTEADKYRYQGAELQFIGFDELTQFPEGWYRYLLSRLRRVSGSRVPIRARSASNPGGLGHDWVKRRFVDRVHTDCVFVPASLADNPSIDQAGYAKTLEVLDETTRNQLLHGIWVRDSGGLVYRFDEAKNLTQQAPHGSYTYLLGMDFGVTDDSSFAVLAQREHDPTVYVIECYKRKGMAPSDAAEEAQQLEEKYKFVKMVGDVGGLGKAFSQEMRTRFSLPIDPAEKLNKLGYISLFNGALEAGLIKVAKGTCQELIKEWLELPWDKGNQKESPGFDNHCADACLYAWRACTAFHEKPLEDLPKPGSDEYYEEQEQLIQDKLEERLMKTKRGEWWMDNE